MQWLDLGELSIRAGVELSYLTECEQDILWQINTVDNSGHMLMKISESQARDLRVLSADCKKESLELSGNQILKVLAIKKKKPDKKIAINPNTYKKYFTDKSNDEIQQIVEQALEMYYNDRKDA